MLTGDIDAILSRHPHTRNHYLGTYPVDSLPTQRKPLTCFVSNTDPHDEPGEHWVAVYTTRDRETFFFDPYGIPPITPEHLRYCHRSKAWDYNRRQIQKLTSKTCGIHCIRFLITACQLHNPYLAIVRMWRQKRPTTDAGARKYLRETVKALTRTTPLNTLTPSSTFAET